MPILRAGQDVTIIHRAATGQDEYGNDIYDSVAEIVSGCAVSPGQTSEETGATIEVFSSATIHFPPGTLIGPEDQVLIFDQKYQVVGQPVSWKSPFTGTVSLIEARVRLVLGGAPAT